MNSNFVAWMVKSFIRSKLTPVLMLSSLIMGMLAVYLTPKEEEPQISVPMIDILIPSPGMGPEEVEKSVTELVEKAIWGIDGLEYVYSSSRPHASLVTARFKVGQNLEDSLVKIHHKVMSLQGELPQETRPPQVKSYSIDDVPFLAVTFASGTKSDADLRALVAPLAKQLASTPDLSRVDILGGLRKSLRVVVRAKDLSAHGLSMLNVMHTLSANHLVLPAGKNWGKDQSVDIDVGFKPFDVAQVQNLTVAQRGGGYVQLKQVADVFWGPEERVRQSKWFSSSKAPQGHEAVTLVFAKRKNTNVVSLAKQVEHRIERFAKELPRDVGVHTIRNYGETAKEKSDELMKHILLATFSVAVLIALFMGLRAALVVAIAIPVTLALTLAIYYFMGYTLNRVTLFALIFSIGILVDDAIVVVENIERHLHLGKHKNMLDASIEAVSEIGNPTILATFAVISSILPMAFVKGLMGPYMKPIPVGASVAMMFSLLVAFIVTPWLAVRILKGIKALGHMQEKEHKIGVLDRVYGWVMNSMIATKLKTALFGGFVTLLFLASCFLVYNKNVKVKMLPFDNKNEFQVLLDYAPETTLARNVEQTEILAKELLKHEDIKEVQIFSGEAAPYSFSGMVKHTFLRQSDELADLHVVLKDKHGRKKSSHDVISDIRPVVSEFAKTHGAVSKVLEIPPGPPVLATMLAEIYGPSQAEREKVANEMMQIFSKEASVVDLDSTERAGRSVRRYEFDTVKGGRLGIVANDFAQLGRLVFSESPVFPIANTPDAEEPFLTLSMDQNTRSGSKPFLGQSLVNMTSGFANLSLLTKEPTMYTAKTLYRKNLVPVSYVMSELSGAEEAPVYGMLKLSPHIKYTQQTAQVPWDTEKPVIKWDGEWFITYEVFRDLGFAFAIVTLLMYVLILAWFRSFLLPLIIMTPIPMSLIGVLTGHWIMGAYFTATSMIGFIAGAGIIVRNSIILVDFIELQLSKGMQLKEAVISAGILRFRPMLLTAAAVVVGSSVMLKDPIFQGLAVSLIFGEVAATLISRFAVPVLYYWLAGTQRQKEIYVH